MFIYKDYPQYAQRRWGGEGGVVVLQVLGEMKIVKTKIFSYYRSF